MDVVDDSATTFLDLLAFIVDGDVLGESVLASLDDWLSVSLGLFIVWLGVVVGLVHLQPLLHGEGVLHLEQVAHLFNLIQSVLGTVSDDVAHHVVHVLVKVET